MQQSCCEDSALADALTCPICTEILVQPCAFGPCNHNFCRSCLLHWADARLAHDLEEAHDDDEYAALLQETPLVCPVCRRNGLPPARAAGMYQTNKALDAAVKLVRQPAWPTCEAHGRRLDYYCFDCNEASCGHCAIIGKHRGHALRPIDEGLLTVLDAEIEVARDELDSWCKRRLATEGWCKRRVDRWYADGALAKQEGETVQSILRTLSADDLALDHYLGDSEGKCNRKACGRPFSRTSNLMATPDVVFRV